MNIVTRIAYVTSYANYVLKITHRLYLIEEYGLIPCEGQNGLNGSTSARFFNDDKLPCYEGQGSCITLRAKTRRYVLISSEPVQ